MAVLLGIEPHRIGNVVAQPARKPGPLHPLTRIDDGHSSVLDPTSPHGRGDAAERSAQVFARPYFEGDAHA
jgi:hypothetical protein